MAANSVPSVTAEGYLGIGGEAEILLGGPASQLLCRVRPCDKPSPLVAVRESQARIEVGPEKGHPGEPLRFDRVLASHGDKEQEELFGMLRPAIEGCMSGTSCTVVAFGGPQSGKTHTLSGFSTQGKLHGMAPQAIELIAQMLEHNPGMPLMDASFFDILPDADRSAEQQEDVSDLLRQDRPQVSLHETSEKPYVLIDASLTAQRCGSSDGKLLDVYFTGLENRRKGRHSCFQIAFLDPTDGSHMSFLRFVEMAWPRPQDVGLCHHLAPGNVASPQQASVGTPPAEGRECAALEQVLQCKLTGVSASLSYQSSPLALLLKPCFEGASLMYFIYCLRVEHMQLPCLAAAAPLLAKLHLWLTMCRKGALAAPAPGPRPIVDGAAPVPTAQSQARVPKLRLATQEIAAAPVPGPEYVVGGDPSDASASCSTSFASSPSYSRSGPVVLDDESRSAPVALPVPVLAQPTRMVVAPPQGEEVSQASQDALEEMKVEDSSAVRACIELMEVKRQSAAVLHKDAVRSAAVLNGLADDLGRLQAGREAPFGATDCGPSEPETNLKMLYEQVSKSLRRTTDEIQKMHYDIEVLAQFCGGGSIPPIFDHYNVTKEDVEIMAQHMASQEAMESQPAAGPGVASNTATIHAGQVEQLNLGPTPATRVPALPLGLLTQEPVELPPELAGKGPYQFSPSSSSSSGSDLASEKPDIDWRVGGTASPPARAWPQDCHALREARPTQAPDTRLLQPSLGFPTRSFSQVPKTPPVPPAAWNCPTWPSQGGGASTLQRGGHAASSGQLLGPQRGAKPEAPEERSRGASLTASMSDIFHKDGGCSVEVRIGTPLPPRSPEPRRRLVERSSWRPISGATTVAPPMPEGAGQAERSGDANRVRKSHSTTSLRSSSLRVAPSSPVPMHCASPMMGTRAEFVGASPLRCSVPAGQGNGSPPLPPRRGSASVAVPGPAPSGQSAPQQQGGFRVVPPRAYGIRPSTPASRLVAPVLGEDRRSRGSGGIPQAAHLASPVMLSRNPSTQALRAPGMRPAQARASSKQPLEPQQQQQQHHSPERSRVVAAASPLRGSGPSVGGGYGGRAVQGGTSSPPYSAWAARPGCPMEGGASRHGPGSTPRSAPWAAPTSLG